MAHRVVIVEDHGLIAQAVASALRAQGETVDVIDPVHTADLPRAIAQRDPDLVLLDLDLGSKGEATPLIAPLAAEGVPVVMVTGVTDPVRLARCVAAGAAGVLSKDISFDELLAAIERALSNGTLLSKHERDEQLAVLRTHDRDEEVRRGPFDALTTREAEVLGELVQGRTVNEIATSSVVSVATVRTQVRSILTKLDVGSQLAAIARARDAGWQPPQEG